MLRERLAKGNLEAVIQLLTDFLALSKAKLFVGGGRVRDEEPQVVLGVQLLLRREVPV